MGNVKNTNCFVCLIGFGFALIWLFSTNHGIFNEGGDLFKFGITWKLIFAGSVAICALPQEFST